MLKTTVEEIEQAEKLMKELLDKGGLEFRGSCNKVLTKIENTQENIGMTPQLLLSVLFLRKYLGTF